MKECLIRDSLNSRPQSIISTDNTVHVAPDIHENTQSAVIDDNLKTNEISTLLDSSGGENDLDREQNLSVDYSTSQEDESANLLSSTRNQNALVT